MSTLKRKGEAETVDASGRSAYESDVVRRPTYHDGTARKTWDKLDAVAKWSWGRAFNAEGR